MKIEDIVNEVKKALNKEEFKASDDSDVRICVLQRGWVVVGIFSQSGTQCRLENASVIRTWGTTKGLGEIAENGPIEGKTVLDPCPPVIFHELVGVFQMICRANKWKNHLR